MSIGLIESARQWHKETEALTALWNVLHGYREDSIPEGDEAYDAEWDSICESMAVIHEALNINQEDT